MALARGRARRRWADFFEAFWHAMQLLVPGAFGGAMGAALAAGGARISDWPSFFVAVAQLADALTHREGLTAILPHSIVQGTIVFLVHPGFVFYVCATAALSASTSNGRRATRTVWRAVSRASGFPYLFWLLNVAFGCIFAYVLVC